MPYVAELNIDSARVGELAAEVMRLRADLALIAAEFVQQAIDRDWCGEYENWTRIINRRTSRPHFIARTDLNEEQPAAVNQVAEPPGAWVHTRPEPTPHRRQIGHHPGDVRHHVVDAYDRSILTVGALKTMLERVPDAMHIVMDNNVGWYSNVNEVIVPGSDPELTEWSAVTFVTGDTFDARQT